MKFIRTKPEEYLNLESIVSVTTYLQQRTKTVKDPFGEEHEQPDGQQLHIEVITSDGKKHSFSGLAAERIISAIDAATIS